MSFGVGRCANTCGTAGGHWHEAPTFRHHHDSNIERKVCHSRSQLISTVTFCFLLPIASENDVLGVVRSNPSPPPLCLPWAPELRPLDQPQPAICCAPGNQKSFNIYYIDSIVLRNPAQVGHPYRMYPGVAGSKGITRSQLDPPIRTTRLNLPGELFTQFV